MKLGILCHGFAEWGGGIDFLRLVCSSLVAADKSIELHFLYPRAHTRHAAIQAAQRIKQRIKQMLGRSSVQVSGMELDHLTGVVRTFRDNSFFHVIDSGEASLRRSAMRIGLDALLPSMHPLLDAEVPWLGYLYDYQHRYFPKLFSARELKDRDAHFAAMLGEASHVIVNAKSVERDVQKFHPAHTSRIVVLPFSASPSIEWLEADRVDPQMYGVGPRYFMVCNQFWQHKGHLTAFEAFAKVLQKYPDVNLVCTGATTDYRNPDYFGTLGAKAVALGVSENLKVLGLIPKADQIGLLRNAISLIQPTLFEGGPGGGAVYDAVALGVSALVSDIPVNLELDESCVEFFPAEDSSVLAELMIRQLESQKTPRASNETLLAQGLARRVRCGDALMHAIKEAQFVHRRRSP